MPMFKTVKNKAVQFDSLKILNVQYKKEKQCVQNLIPEMVRNHVTVKG